MGATSDDYRLSVGDVLTFDFLDDALPAEQLTVSSDGEITVPLIGGFRVAGLSLSEAMAAMRATFVDRRLFVAPQISLAVASFRPIFVLGDVKAPGSFAFQPTLTVEQAVALAGGQSTGGATAEDRVVARARLRGVLDESAAAIAQEAVASARVSTQLAGRTTITTKDLPEDARDILGGGLVAALMPTEQKILEAEERAFETRRVQLTAAVGEVTGALANLNELAEQQKQVIASAKADVARAKELGRRGIKTLTDISAVERDALAQDAQLLQIFNQMSTTRRELGALQLQLADATDNRTHTALQELQTHNAQIQQLLAARRSTEEQILLLSNLVAEEARKVDTIAFSYKIRRKTDGRTAVQPATLDDLVFPGDTILVAIDRDGIEPGATLSALEPQP